MANGSSASRHYDGPEFLAQGFRPFFFAAGAWAALAIPLWLMFYGGTAEIGLSDPLGWHVHEMIWGFGAATIAGFALTAIPNWTGRLPMRGIRLALLFGLWLAGRAAMLAEPYLGVWTAVVDNLFMIVLALSVWRELTAGKNWRNTPVAGALTLLALANICWHLAQHAEIKHLSDPDIPLRLAIAGIIALILLIGGRITPSFTRNWLAKRGEASLPAAISKLDLICLCIAIVGLASWVVAKEGQITGALLVLGGLATAFRLIRWKGLSCFSEPLVLILHIGYGWAALGMVLVGLEALGWAGNISGIHGLTVGAVGVMTLAVMTRATLGHSGQPLAADRATNLVYILINLAALVRCFGSLVPVLDTLHVSISGWLWLAAFGLYTVRYSPYFFARR